MSRSASCMCVSMLLLPVVATAEKSEPLMVQQVTFLKSEGRFEATLMNVSEKPVTGGSVVVTATYPDGATSVTRQTFEFFPSVGLEHLLVPVNDPRNHAGALEPGQFFIMNRGIPSRADAIPPDEVVVRVASVIFADATATGDEGDLSKLFARRAAEAKELVIWSRRLDEVASNPRQSFLSGLRELKSKADKEHEASVSEAVAGHSNVLTSRDASSLGYISGLLQQSIDRIERGYATETEELTKLKEYFDIRTRVGLAQSHRKEGR